jgi:hypothetical protein
MLPLHYTSEGSGIASAGEASERPMHNAPIMTSTGEIRTRMWSRIQT